MASPVLGSATSPAYEAARFPVGSNSRTAAFSFATSRPLMMTEPPSAMKREATSLPIPDAPPVITATLSPNLIATSIHYLSVGRHITLDVDIVNLYLSIDRGVPMP